MKPKGNSIGLKPVVCLHSDLLFNLLADGRLMEKIRCECCYGVVATKENGHHYDVVNNIIPNYQPILPLLPLLSLNFSSPLVYIMLPTQAGMAFTYPPFRQIMMIVVFLPVGSLRKGPVGIPPPRARPPSTRCMVVCERLEGSRSKACRSPLL